MKLKNSVKVLNAFLLLNLASQAFGAEKLELGWSNLYKFYKDQYQKNSPEKDSKRAVYLQKKITGGLLLDPGFSVTYTKNTVFNPLYSQGAYPVGSATPTPDSANPSGEISANSGGGATGNPIGVGENIGLGIKQSFAFGTSLSYTVSRDPHVKQYSSTMGVTQALLKDGLFFPFLQYDTASIEYKISDLKRVQTFDSTFNSAVGSFIAAVLAQKNLELSKKSYENAVLERKAIEGMVESGHKAKADLLVFMSSELRAELSFKQAKNANADALRNLCQAFWLSCNNNTIELIINNAAPEAEIEKRLFSVSENPEATELRIAQYERDNAALQKSMALKNTLPSLDLSYNFSKTSNSRANNKQWVLNFSVPLGSVIDRSKLELASLNEVKANAAYEEIVVKHQSNLASLQAKTTLLKESFETNKKLLELLTQTAEIEKQKYNDGKSTIFQVKQTQTEVDTAALQVEQSRADLLKAGLDVALSNGVITKIFNYE